MFQMYLEIGIFTAVILYVLGHIPAFKRRFGKVSWGDLAGMLFVWPFMVPVVYGVLKNGKFKDEEDF